MALSISLPPGTRMFPHFLACSGWTTEKESGYGGYRGWTSGSRWAVLLRFRGKPLDYSSRMYFLYKNGGLPGHLVTSSSLENRGWKMDQLELAVKVDRILVMDETRGVSRTDHWFLVSCFFSHPGQPNHHHCSDIRWNFRTTYKLGIGEKDFIAAETSVATSAVAMGVGVHKLLALSSPNKNGFTPASTWPPVSFQS